MQKRIAIYFAALAAFTGVAGFTPQDDFSACKKELKQYIDELARIKEPSGKKVYHMRMTIKTDMSPQSRMPDAQTDVEVFMSARQMHYISNVLTTYQDEHDAFAVLPQRKTIVWSAGGKSPDAKAKKEQAIHIQDTLITVSKITNCRTVEENGKTYKQLTMVPFKKAMETFRVSRIDYFINSAEKRIEKVNTYYQAGAEIEMQSITYHELDLNYSKSALQKPVYGQIFASSGKLLSRYKGYQLVDNKNQ